MPQMNLSTKQKQLIDIENRFVVAKGKGEGVGWTERLGLVDANYLLHLGQRSSEVLLYSTGNYIHSLVLEHDRR